METKTIVFPLKPDDIVLKVTVTSREVVVSSLPFEGSFMSDASDSYLVHNEQISAGELNELNTFKAPRVIAAA